MLVIIILIMMVSCSSKLRLLSYIHSNNTYSSVFPSPRSDFILFSFNSSLVYIFSGRSIDSTSQLGLMNDLWIKNGTWQLIHGSTLANQKAKFDGNYKWDCIPGSRYGSSKWMLRNTNEMIFYGGFGYTDKVDDPNKYGTLYNYWWYSADLNMFKRGVEDEKSADKKGKYNEYQKWENMDKAWPSSRVFSNLWNHEHNEMHGYLFGGYGVDRDDDNIRGYLNDLFIFDFDEGKQYYAASDGYINNYGVYGEDFSTSNIAGGRMGCAVWVIGLRVFLFGGIGFANSTFGHLNDLWEIDDSIDDQIQFKHVSGSIEAYGELVSNTYQEFDEFNTPPSLSFMFYWTLNDESLIYMYGGQKNSSYLMADLWVFNITSELWKLDRHEEENRLPNLIDKGDYNESTTLGGRSNGAAYHLYEDVVYLFGGKTIEMNITNDWYVSKEFDYCKTHAGLYDGYECIYDHCICNIDGYLDSYYVFCVDCFTWNCEDIAFNDFNNSDLCLSHGDCFQPDNCSCSSNYYGSNCETWYCYDVINSDSSVCNYNGSCVSHGNCSCNDDDYYEDCNMWDCFNYNKTNPLACSSNGTCVSPNKCDCSEGFYEEECSNWNCSNIPKGEDHVCTNHGDCVKPENCSCYSNYYGEDCELWYCAGISRFNTTVCLKRGVCVSHNLCSCEYFEGYYGDNCEEWDCNDNNRLSPSVCNDLHGKCVSYDNCECLANFYGRDCDENIISGYYEVDSKIIFISYIISEDLSETLNVNIDCADVVDNLDEMGTDTKCSWVFNDGIIEKLKIYVGRKYKFKLQNIVNITVQSDEDTIVSVRIDKMILPESINPLSDVIIIMVFIVGCMSILIVIISIGLVTKFVIMKKIGSNEGEEQLHKMIFGADDTEVKVKINKDLLRIDHTDILLQDIIGSGGSSATIFKGLWKGKKIAIKIFKTQDYGGTPHNLDEFEKEVSLLSSISHPNIIQLYGICISSQRIGFVSEYCEYGDLRKYYYYAQTKNIPFFEFKEKIRILIEIADALGYLHDREIIHRDLKCDNVLLNESFTVKLTDFGVSKLRISSDGDNTKHVGTSIYMAPEVTHGDPYNESCDIFSFAICAFEIISDNFTPYDDQISKEEYINIEIRVSKDSTFRPRFSDELMDTHPSLVELIKRMWDSNANVRPNVIDVRKLLMYEQRLIEVEEERRLKDLCKEIEKKIQPMLIQNYNDK